MPASNLVPDNHFSRRSLRLCILMDASRRFRSARAIPCFSSAAFVFVVPLSSNIITVLFSLIFLLY